MSGLPLSVHATAGEAATAAAAIIATEIRIAVEARGTASVAFSGGTTPAAMLSELRAMALPWGQVRVFQVDEREAPSGHPDRNATALVAALADRPPLPRLWLLPIGHGTIDAGEVADYERAMGQLDVVHLGLGADGHTASLVPGDPVLEVRDRDVALTGPYQGRRRLTLTAPCINRARRIVWLVTGADKQRALALLSEGAGDVPAHLIPAHLVPAHLIPAHLIPAHLIARDHAVIVCDSDAAGGSGLSAG